MTEAFCHWLLSKMGLSWNHNPWVEEDDAD